MTNQRVLLIVINPTAPPSPRGNWRDIATYHTTRKSEQYAQRIQRNHDHTSQRTDEASREPNKADDKEPDSEEDFIICDGGGATVSLRCDQVAAETEDYDCEEYLQEMGC